MKYENLAGTVSENGDQADVSTRFSFRYFKDGMEKLMMLDNLDEETKDEYMNEWYIMFKEQKHKTVVDFVEWQFPISEVNESTHDFCSRRKGA